MNELKILHSQKKAMDFQFTAEHVKEDNDIFDEELKEEDESSFEQNEIGTIIDKLEAENAELCLEYQFDSDYIDAETDNDILEKEQSNEGQVGNELEEIPQFDIDCEFCSRRFLNAIAYNSHLAEHESKSEKDDPEIKPSGSKEPEPETERVEFYFKNPVIDQLEHHQDSEVANVNETSENDTFDRTFSCEKCPKRFKSSWRLKEHDRNHSGEKPYGCDSCPKRFVYSSSLNIHKRTHTGERPYKCQSCQKSFTHLQDYKDHINIHSVEKPYDCKTCLNSSTRNCDLPNHIEIHNGEKVLECNACH